MRVSKNCKIDVYTPFHSSSTDIVIYPKTSREEEMVFAVTIYDARSHAEFVQGFGFVSWVDEVGGLYIKQGPR